MMRRELIYCGMALVFGFVLSVIGGIMGLSYETSKLPIIASIVIGLLVVDQLYRTGERPTSS